MCTSLSTLSQSSVEHMQRRSAKMSWYSKTIVCMNWRCSRCSILAHSRMHALMSPTLVMST